MHASTEFHLGQPRLFLDEAVSTNDVARRHAEERAPEGLTVIAAGQTGGRGRRGRTWISGKGQGLYMSVVLRPSWPASEVGWLSTLGGVAVAEALAEAGIRNLRLKWPNDVLVGTRKIAGILVEPRLGGGKIEFAIVGLGVNVLQAAEDWPGELAGQATSCRMEGVILTPERMADLVVKSLEGTYRVAAVQGFGMLLEKWVAWGGANKRPEIE